MFASLLYYFFLKNRNWTFGRKFSCGIFFVYATYYILYYSMFYQQIYSKMFYWVTGIDIFILAIFLVKYKNMKWDTFVGRAIGKVA